VAPINPNNTARLKVFYQNAVAEHTLLIRFDGVDGLADAQTRLGLLVSAMSPLTFFCEVTAVQQAAEGLDIFNDVPGATILGLTWGSGPCTEEVNAVAGTFIGRSTAGRRSRLSFFGYKGATSDYRLTSTESSDIADALDALDGADGSFLSIDGNAPIWKRYIDVKAFDHWVDATRNG